MFLKASWGLGWGSHDYRIGLGGEGATPLAETFGATYLKSIIPVDGIFSHLTVYSPAGQHPNYTVTAMINGVASALTCTLAPTADLATDRDHAVTVVAGDDIYLSVDVNPFGSGAGYPLNISLEFEGAQQFYSVTPGGSRNGGTYATGGALGNGILEPFASPTALSNTYSICTTAGTLTGIRMKTYVANTGGSWTAYIVKNQVVQDGTGGTVDTACVLTDGTVQASNTFSLSIAVSDRLDFAMLRSGTTVGSTEALVALSSLFNPTDPDSFMCCGGNNDANTTGTDYKWVQSEQLIAMQDMSQCPVGPRGIHVLGLRIELPVAPESATPGIQSRTFTILKNGANTAADVTISENETSGSISGFNIPFADGDFIVLRISNANTPLTGNGLKWGLSMTPAPSLSPSERSRIRRVRRAPHLSAEQAWQFFSTFQLDFEPGVGSTGEPGVDPQVTLRWSDDGGHTWHEPLTVSAGLLGAYQRRAIWRRLGRGRDRVFEIIVDDPVKWALVAAYLEAQKGTS